jgi:hypothetical protein
MVIDSETRNKLKVARVKCDESLMFFTRFFFKELRGSKFLTNWHHEDINKALDDVANYKYELININIPPRCSKTEIVLNFIAKSLGENQSANFLYITASDELRGETSVRIRDIITHPYFYFMYGVEIKKDQNSKNLWRTNKGGGLKTATIFGQITGFGAGQMTDIEDLQNYIREFEGCIVLDDINKIDDAETISANNKKVTRVIFNTVMSRKNSSDTPVINIQQRAGLEDATAKLLDYYKSNNSIDKVKNLVYPAIIDGESIWAKQLTLESLKQKRDSPLTSRMFKTQYMQEPVPEEGGIIKRDWFNIVNKSMVNGKYEIYIDGAYTKNTANDPTGILLISKMHNSIAIHDFTEKWLVLPDLIDYLREYMTLHNVNSNTPIYVEPKASGLDFVNTGRKYYNNPFIEISKKTGSKFVLVSKDERMNASSDYIKAGMVNLIEGNWNKSYIDYMCNFPNDIHDEACDLTCYAIEKNLINRNNVNISYG